MCSYSSKRRIWSDIERHSGHPPSMPLRNLRKKSVKRGPQFWRCALSPAYRRPPFELQALAVAGAVVVLVVIIPASLRSSMVRGRAGDDVECGAIFEISRHVCSALRIEVSVFRLSAFCEIAKILEG